VEETSLDLSSNGGFLALGKIDSEMGLISGVLDSFKDGLKHRLDGVKQEKNIQHSFVDLLKQRVYQIALGYEDGLDANDLRHDSNLQLAVGKDQSLGSQPMMSRLENWVSSKDLYRGFRSLVTIYAREFYKRGEIVSLHIDSTDDPVHGQLGLFNGYYDEHCFHPLLVSCERTEFPFGIILRNGPVGSADNAKSMLKRLIAWLREEIPGVNILIKGDCAFGNGDLINWFDEQKIDYILGVGGNSILYKQTAALAADVLSSYQASKIPLQRFMSLTYQAESWNEFHAVVAKVEHTALGMNIRFVVSSMMSEDPSLLYKGYHGRAKGIESVIEQLKNGLRVDKSACHKLIPNQMRYFESALAFIMHLKLKEKLAKILPECPTVQTIIQKVLKVASIVTRSARRYLIQLPSSDPHTRLLMHVLQT
jgi:Transposase DDE domain group 1